MRIKIFIFFILLLFTSCNNTKKSSNKIKIGVALYNGEDTFIKSIKDIIVKEALEQEKIDDTTIILNVEDSLGNQALQNEQVDNFISQGYDAICVNMVDRTAAAVIIDKAKAFDIPVVFFNREPVSEDLNRWDKVYYVGAKAEQSGRIQGKLIVDLFRSNLSYIDKNNDNIIQYVMIEGELGHQDALLRTEYSIKTITSFGIQVEKLANDSSSWKRSIAKEKMAKRLQELGNSIEVVLANNDDMALGAIDAIQEAGFEFTKNSNIVVVGIDATTQAIESIKTNLLHGTVLNDNISQGKAIFELAYSSVTKAKPITSIKGFNGKSLLTEYYPVTLNNLNVINNDKNKSPID